MHHSLHTVYAVTHSLVNPLLTGMEEAHCDRTEFLSNYMTSVDDIILIPGSLGRIRSRFPNNPKCESERARKQKLIISHADVSHLLIYRFETFSRNVSLIFPWNFFTLLPFYACRLECTQACMQSTLIKRWQNTPNLDEEALAFFLDFVKTHEMLHVLSCTFR